MANCTMQTKAKKVMRGVHAKIKHIQRKAKHKGLVEVIKGTRKKKANTRKEKTQIARAKTAYCNKNASNKSMKTLICCGQDAKLFQEERICSLKF